MERDLFGHDSPAPDGAPVDDDRETAAPLADRMRPRDLDDLVGQRHLLDPGRPLRQLIEKDALPSLLLWGPPGCGKTSLARVIAGRTRAHFLEYSAVQVGSKELKEVMAEAGRMRRSLNRRTIIFLDEIHRFNKAQQDALLPWIEKGDVVLIGATTENPSFEINAALISRTRLFVLEPLERDDLSALLRRALASPDGPGPDAPEFADDALDALATLSDGDGRTALNLLEMAAAAAGAFLPAPDAAVDRDVVAAMIQDRALRYDRAGEEHYNLISALHKSVRNSDPDAALYYLARMLEAGEDPLFVARRLVRMASEDVGLADPQALPQTVAAKEAVQFVGMPEAALALAQACVYCSLAPKSNALYMGYGAAAKTVVEGVNPPVPLHLRNAPTKLMKKLGYGDGYDYAHDSPTGVSAMECLPDRLRGRRFYEPTARGLEARYGERLKQILEWRSRQGRDDDEGDEA